jgi:hypothetical protein
MAAYSPIRDPIQTRAVTEIDPTTGLPYDPGLPPTDPGVAPSPGTEPPPVDPGTFTPPTPDPNAPPPTDPGATPTPTPPGTPSTDPGGTPTPTPAPGGGTDTTGTSSNWPNWLSALGITPNAITSAGPYAALIAASLYEANKAKQQNDAYAGTLTGLGQPLVAAGSQQLSAAQGGVLNPQVTGYQNQAFQTGAQLQGEAGPLLSIANTAFQQYTAGALPPWQQTELDQQRAAAKQELRQSLGSNVDSSTLSAYDSNIDTQYDIAKGQAMLQNLQTGEGAFTLGVDTQQLGYSDIQAGWQAGIDAIQAEFNNAVALSTAGFGPIEAGINLAVSSNTQLTDMLTNMFGTIGLAYAIQQSGNRNASSGGGGGGGPKAGGGGGGGGGGQQPAPGTGVPPAPITPTDPNTGLPTGLPTWNPQIDPNTGLPIDPSTPTYAPDPNNPYNPGGPTPTAPTDPFGAPGGGPAYDNYYTQGGGEPFPGYASYVSYYGGSGGGGDAGSFDIQNT